MTPVEKAHLRILRIVADDPQITQRELARQLGISLGKANYLLRALLDKGHVKVSNFLHAENKLKYAYLLTPEGISAKLDLTRDYVSRVEEEYATLRVEVEAMRAELARADVESL